MNSRAQIVATIGPASYAPEVLAALVAHQMDIVRLNFAWLTAAEGAEKIDSIRAAIAATGKHIPIIVDLPGPRIQLDSGHTYDNTRPVSITESDEEKIKMCAEKGIEYIALSFVGSAEDVLRGREVIKKYGGTQKIISKIERKIAIDNLDSILAVSDAVMVARGDLGSEVPLEEIPFVQKLIIQKANAAGKPVITATQMMLWMAEHPEPTRAEVTDVEQAIMDGSDAVMLSEESASGKFPVETVSMMERVLVAAERHRTSDKLHLL